MLFRSAPKGELTIIEGDTRRVVDYINQEVERSIHLGKRTGIIATAETETYYKQGIVKVIGQREHEASVAHGLYAVLREFDELEVQVIFTESFGEDELGQAIMNRLLKAAGYHIIRV